MLYVSTELDAINLILASIGEAPVNTLNSESIDADNAKALLMATSRNTQRQGWQFNTVLGSVLLPDNISKRILYNPTWIKLIPTDGFIYVKRGEYLFNLSENTYEFDKEITVNIVEAVDFDDLPDEFKTYITAQTAIIFQSRYLGDDSISEELRAEMAQAYSDIVQYSIDTGTNMYQMTGMQSALERR